jgi:hypothetical protein
MDDERRAIVQSRKCAILRDLADVGAKLDELDRLTGRLRTTSEGPSGQREVGLARALEELEAAARALKAEMGWVDSRGAHE